MIIPITIPSPGESITEVTLGAWHKRDGEWAEKDDLLVEIESDKATLELRAPEAGRVAVKAQTGAELPVGAEVGSIDTDAERTSASAPAKEPAKGADREMTKKEGSAAEQASEQAGEDGRKGRADAPVRTAGGEAKAAPAPAEAAAAPRATSVARKMAADRGVSLEGVQGTGPSGRITKRDVLAAADREGDGAREGTEAKPATAPAVGDGAARGERTIRRERMTKLRQRIAERLVEAQHTAAMLTTFNEADMTEVMRLRSLHKERFEKLHGVGLGFMSFFVRACVSALQLYPRVNAYIVGDDQRGMEIEHHDYIDIAVAVGTDRGLVVPVVRNADRMSFAEIELAIRDLATKARAGKLTVDELTGGTFTISNGGVYGSLMSTPILNPPQSGILGMHAIKNRPVEDPRNPGQIVLRPMMYLALSYDHRIVDGAEAVGFLVHVKNCIEQPERMLLGV